MLRALSTAAFLSAVVFLGRSSAQAETKSGKVKFDLAKNDPALKLQAGSKMKMEAVFRSWKVGDRVSISYNNMMKNTGTKNPGMADILNKPESGSGGAKAAWDANLGYASSGCLKVSSTSPGVPQVRHCYLQGWKYPIVERPGPGEYRYLRFAVKMRSGTFANIVLGSPEVAVTYAIAKPAADNRSYVIADKPPSDWLVVTRDLQTDAHANFLETLFKIETDGEVMLDGVYLGRSVRDLNKFTPKPAAVGGK
jgi:hypothetical protein